jgi:hypothetical protein
VAWPFQSLLLHLPTSSAGRHLIELDAVACSFPHRVWYVPPTLLLPQQVSKNVHFKIGVKGSLEDGKVGGFECASYIVAWL